MNRQQRRQMARLEPAAAARNASGQASASAALLFSKGVQRFQAGQLIEAMDFYQQALTADPQHIGSLHHLGLIAIQIGRPEVGVDMVGRALALNERNAELHQDMGFALVALGRIADAVEHAERALALKPDCVNAHLLLGDVFLRQHKLDEAIAAYRQAVALDPTHAGAHNNIGTALFGQGHLNEAAQSFKEAIRLKPDVATAYRDLATICVIGGDASQALNVVMQGLQVVETPLLKGMFVKCLYTATSLSDSDALRHYIVRALSEPWGHPTGTVPASTALVKLTPPIKRCLDRASASWPAQLSCEELFDSDGLRATAGDPLLRALLQSSPILDIDMERFFTLARSALLEAATAASTPDGDDDAVLTFCCMLARQCFVNEHVFAHAADEQAKVETLRDQVAAALRSGDTVAPLTLAIIASYQPLYSIPGFEALLTRSWSSDVDDLLTQQIREPLAERTLRSKVPLLTPIENDVSVAVRSQYEESPYPRWVKFSAQEVAHSLDESLRRDYPHSRYRPIVQSDGLDVLIAGCGTGLQTVVTASRYAGARVLAVDLSLASICYGSYRSQALGLNNIEYGQADILKLGTLNRQFDLIACTGVLHHLSDPLEGWRILLSMLRPNGIMFIALYSELARADVVATRDFIATRGYKATIDDIRRCRQDIIALDESPERAIVRRADFYSTSNCRDLLFHVQEHRFTIPQIKDFLAANGLEFIGFELEATESSRYRAQFPDDPAGTDLDHWHEYEQKNPHTFASMYQFVVQKQA
jgi:tetratricopeptide (TPR) repeat protein/2-polyprenyl-3-methyl-5-hydroxy-6-metoxy-1,4-benzoquinol methylase